MNNKDFKIGDLVIIVKELPNSYINRVGLSGFVESFIDDDHIYFKELRKDGLGGMGSVPKNCIRHNESEELKILYEVHNAYINKLNEKRLAINKEVDTLKSELINKIKSEFNLSEDKIEGIIKLVVEFTKDVNNLVG